MSQKRLRLDKTQEEMTQQQREFLKTIGLDDVEELHRVLRGISNRFKTAQAGTAIYKELEEKEAFYKEVLKQYTALQG